MKSANKVKMRTSIIVLFFIIVAAFCKYAYRLSDVLLFDKFAVFVRVFIYKSCRLRALLRSDAVCSKTVSESIRQTAK